MLTPIPTSGTCAAAWLQAVRHLGANGNEAYNLVVDIDDPIKHTKQDDIVILAVDGFLRSKRAYPISTVVNTIFPQRLYQQYGDDRFIPEYIKSYDAIRRVGWGRYFDRMIRWPGTGDQTTNQLSDLINRLRKQRESRQTYRNVYEMTLFDPARDAQRNRGRQCLSFLSFKLHPQRGLMLTAVYRNHSYIARALGNFIGLGCLMGYIAKQIGTQAGPLTCVSTHAELDTASAKADPNQTGEACLGWKLAEVRELIQAMPKLPKPITQPDVTTPQVS